MSSSKGHLERVLFAYHLFRTAAKTRDGLLLEEGDFNARVAELDNRTVAEIESQIEYLESHRVGVLSAESTLYPSALTRRGKAVVPALFYRGDIATMDGPLVAVSGSRNVSDRGAAAASRLGEVVAQTGYGLISGKARGVDSLASTSALQSGGVVVLVLPEGIASVDWKEFANSDSGRILVLSQFTPSQRWTVHGAMERNRVICGLANTVVVVEAGETGGSLAAGREALKIGRQLLAFTYREDTPPGNRILLREGARAVSSPDELREILSSSGDEAREPHLF